MKRYFGVNSYKLLLYNEQVSTMIAIKYVDTDLLCHTVRRFRDIKLLNEHIHLMVVKERIIRNGEIRLTP